MRPSFRRVLRRSRVNKLLSLLLLLFTKNRCFFTRLLASEYFHAFILLSITAGLYN